MNEEFEPNEDMERLERLADMLIRRGLLCRKDHGDDSLRRESLGKDSQRLPVLQINPPRWAAGRTHSLRLRDLANFLLACLGAAWSLRWYSLEEIVSRIASARREEGPSALLATLELVRVFRRLRRWLFSEERIAACSTRCRWFISCSATGAFRTL